MNSTPQNQDESRSLMLSDDERTVLAAFLVAQRQWVFRHSFQLETVVKQCLCSAGFAVKCIARIEPHPVWHIVLSPAAPGCPRSPLGVRGAVRRAFQIAGHVVHSDCVSIIRCDEQRIEVAISLPKPAKRSQGKSNLRGAHQESVRRRFDGNDDDPLVPSG
jgi:hypothetical protein